MRKLAILLVLLLVVLVSCKGGSKSVELKPFIGGTSGLNIDFLDFRTEVFDGGDDPFDLIVKLENKGEYDVKKANAIVTLSGVRPQEFNKAESDLVKQPSDDILAPTLDSQGNTVAAGPVSVEFRELNHISLISGAALTFPVRADVCYQYQTKSVSKICVLSNLLATDGICVVDEAKPVFNSGAPVQIVNVRQSPQGKDKFRITFDITKSGTGNIFQPSSKCELDKEKNKVMVRVDTHMSGLSCTGLNEASGTAVEGLQTLFDGKKTIQCIQESKKSGDFEQALEITADYTYEDSKTAQITVKSSDSGSSITSV